MKQHQIAVVVAGSLMTASIGAVVAPVATAEGEVLTVSPAKQQAAVAYWTPQRMRNAHQVEVSRSRIERESSRPVAAGPQRVIRALSVSPDALGPATVGARWTKGGKVAKTTGKVFFTIPSSEPQPGDYVCSGSVAPANNKSIIITAGHCVNDADLHSGSPGVYVRNFVFVPGYNGNASDVSPYGVYAATKLRAASQWINNANFSYDVGFVTVGGQTQGPKKGALVANAQGSQGLGFNLARHKYVENFGYPAASPYNGKVLDYSAGYALNADENGSAAGNTVAKDDPDGSNDQVVKSNLTGGSSGGPWFYNFNESTGAGTQVSVNSFSYVGLTTAQQQEYKIPKYNMWGPYFGTGIENVFDAVQGPLPKATSKSVTTPEDTAVKITLSGTKSVSYDPTPLKFIIKTKPAHGTLTRSGNVVTYKPNLNYNGSDKFTYVANNGINNSAPATVSIKITAVAG